MKIGIIGSAEDKFTEKSKEKAISLITDILKPLQEQYPIVVSGHCPLGGIDIWAEWVAHDLGLEMELKVPKQHKWNAEYGYKQRNIDIAKASDVLYVIVADKYPEGYKGMKFPKCYHCGTDDHIKSGGCWTGEVAMRLGKEVYWCKIKN